jgi:hypothetical protein
LAKLKKNGVETSVLVLAIILAIVVILPFGVLIVIRTYYPDTYAVISKLILVDYNNYAIFISLLIFLILARIVLHKENNKIKNKKEKQKVIEQLLNLSDYYKKYHNQLGMSDELYSMFSQKIQILNKQINSEEYRDIPLTPDFFVKMRRVNRPIEKKLFEIN